MLNLAAGFSQSEYTLTRSLRFRASASAYLNRTPPADGNRTKWSVIFAVKRGVIGSGSTQTIFCAATSSSERHMIRFNGDVIQHVLVRSGSTVFDVNTTAVFRDPSAFYLIKIDYDTSQATASDRAKITVNNVQQATTGTYPSLNYSAGYINSTLPHNIGQETSNFYFDGYLAEFIFTDGVNPANSAVYSTNTLTGVAQPAAYTGTYGTNGFYLDFEDTSSVAALGTDDSGNGNNWTVNNVSLTAGVTYDSMTDVPTLTSATASNFCVGNPLSIGPNASLSNGNLSGSLTGSGGWAGSICGLTSGKWYYEATNTASAGNSRWVGFLSDVYTKNDNSWSFSTQTALYANDARNGNNASYGATWTTNDVIGVALDLSTSNGSITFYKNGVSQGVMFSSLTSSAGWRPLISGGGTGTTMVMNFGQQPFAYTPPTGFVALNTFNLPTATILKGNTVMDATLYTGNGSTQTITNAAGFQPDFIWIKRRSGANSHQLVDSIRGTTKYIFSDSAVAEETRTDQVTAFNSNGFSLSTNVAVNAASGTYVGWQWKGGSTVSNTDGTITSQVNANPSSGFSVLTYTGTGVNATVGHGLGVAPKMFIVKGRNAATSPNVWNSALSGTEYFLLEQTTAVQTDATKWNSLTPTSSVINLGTQGATNGNGTTYVMYCFAEIDGFSKLATYVGNGSADGPFVYLGFRPKFLLFKTKGTAGDWIMLDTSRDPENVMDARLQANAADAESTTTFIDAVSNGFKVRTTNANINTSSATVTCMAFSENPFKNSLAR